MFSIFDIGNYSFKPYKVAVSGLYKQTKFSLVEPNGTVLVLDDTCYFIGFDTLREAGYIDIHKTFRGKTPHTICRITQKGILAFEEYVKVLQSYIGQKNDD